MSKISKRGGYRVGAGRPEGSGKYKEKTRPIRIPNSLIPEVEELLAKKIAFPQFAQSSNIYKTIKNFSSQSIPLYSTHIAAGHPMYVDDRIERFLNFNEYLIQNMDTTFCMKVEGDSMIGAGIYENDILVFDQAIKPIDEKVVIVVLNSELTVKRLKLSGNEVILMPENPAYSPIKITEEMDFKVLGVAIHVIHSL